MPEQAIFGKSNEMYPQIINTKKKTDNLVTEYVLVQNYRITSGAMENLINGIQQ